MTEPNQTMLSQISVNMDSKYVSIVEACGKRASNHPKRKGNVNNVVVKRLRLTNNVNHIHLSDPIIKELSVPNLAENKQSSSENIQEARKRLPVYAVRKRLIEEIRKNSTMIIIGETGSGKTTQIPQLIHCARLEGAGAIAVTQPRRVAAITIALRVAAEMNTEVGSIVGYAELLFYTVR